MDLKEQFEKAVAESRKIMEKPSNETLLQLYSLFKQSTEGDNISSGPSNPLDFIAKAKFEAWSAHKGKSQEDAMQEYIDLISKLAAH